MTDRSNLHDRLLDTAIRHLAVAIEAANNGDTQYAAFEKRQCKQAIEGAKSLAPPEVNN